VVGIDGAVERSACALPADMEAHVATILIHKNAKIGLEVTPRTQCEVAVERDGRRVRIRAGQGRRAADSSRH
jgi:hypothetical protein